MDWIKNNYGLLIGLFIQAFIAYHVFFLSKKLSNRAWLSHKEETKQKTWELLSEVYGKKRNSEVYLVNINRYFRDYPSNKGKIFGGYSYIRAEIKATRYDGIEFFSGMPVQIFKTANGMLTFNEKKGVKEFIAFPVGIVPYEWLEHIDLEGDEYAGVPLFYCRFKGKAHWRSWKRFLFYRYPYRKTLYYRNNENYYEGNDPFDLQFRLIDEELIER